MPQEFNLEELKRSDIFASTFDQLFAQLMRIEDQASPEFISAARQAGLFVVDFWRNQTLHQPQLDASFGRDEAGNEQSALGMKILSATETTVCKWGIKEDAKSDRIPRIEILSILLTGEHSRFSYDIDITPLLFRVTRTDWRSRDAEANRSFVVNFK